MMFKCLLCVVVTVLSVLPVECWYRSESCMTGNRAGSCIRLCNCPSLVNEIKRAGNPMPSYLRRKLQHLGCGFDDDEPLVCCNSYSNNKDGDQGDQTLNYIPNTWSTPRPIDQSETNVNFNPIANDPYNNVRGDEDNNNGNDNNESNKPISDVQNHRNLDLLPNVCGAIESDRVFGGNRTRLFEMPWMVLLSYDSARGSQLSCGGTLITQWYVLTAAHCVSFLGSRLKLRNVILGEYDTRKDPDCERNEGELFCAPKIRKVRIDSVIAHSGYTPQNLRDDIALLRLAEPADFSLDSMKPICLPITSELQSERLEGLQGVVAGWGATEDGLQSPVLLSVDLPIITNRECQNIYNGSPQIYETQLCAGGVPDKDSCGGDSGGPLLYPGRSRGVGVRYIQRGIVSYGSKRCGVGGFPGVYTRVVNYMDWILDNISN